MPALRLPQPRRAGNLAHDVVPQVAGVPPRQGQENLGNDAQADAQVDAQAVQALNPNVLPNAAQPPQQAEVLNVEDARGAQMPVNLPPLQPPYVPFVVPRPRLPVIVPRAVQQGRGRPALQRGRAQRRAGHGGRNLGHEAQALAPVDLQRGRAPRRAGPRGRALRGNARRLPAPADAAPVLPVPLLALPNADPAHPLAPPNADPAPPLAPPNVDPAPLAGNAPPAPL